jgi:hypothetical protein
VTHAIVDRLRPSFNVATNPHVRAFHEGFADIVAMFQRLSYRDLVQRALQDAQGDLLRGGGRGATGRDCRAGASQDAQADLRQSQLPQHDIADIAAQFGQGLGSGRALRTALDSKTKIQDVREEHALGAVLVAAIFEGFYTTYERRTADLIRIATGGTGVRPQGALHPDLISRLTSECVRTAQSVLTMCIRAFDYLPPADVTFGAFLRALVTADWELNPLDEVGLRAAIIHACRRRGIFAVEAGSLAVNALLLDVASRQKWQKYEAAFQDWVDLAIRTSIEEQRAVTPEDEEAFIAPPSTSRSLANQAPPVRAEAYASQDEALPAGGRLRTKIKTWFTKLTADERERLGFLRDATLKPPHFHSNRRVTSDGEMRFGLVVQLVQTQTLDVGGVSREFPTGQTLVIDVTGRIRFVIGAANLQSRKQDMEQMARSATTNALGWAIDDASIDPFAVDYHGMHEARI